MRCSKKYLDMNAMPCHVSHLVQLRRFTNKQVRMYTCLTTYLTKDVDIPDDIPDNIPDDIPD